ncbi:MAG: S1 RNA-binding domain-containing protein [Deltaproteobacteria bacterium]|nr:S1 RNA-binding domain-containing protein [Deltaproteobacteria bacterium]
MDYVRFLEATGLLAESGLDMAAAGRLAARLSNRDGISDLIERPPHGLGQLPARTLERLTYAYELYIERRNAVKALEKERQASKAKPLPPEALEKPVYAHSVRALSRVSKAVDAISFDSREARAEALIAGVDLWERCFAIAWRNGKVKSTLVDSQNPDAGDFQDYEKRTEETLTLPPHRWLAMRRGQSLGVLNIELEVNNNSLAGQVTALQKTLAPLLETRSPLSLLEELVLGHLEREVFNSLDREMAAAAMWLAASAYFDLLRSAPIEVNEKLHSVFVPGGEKPVVTAVVSKDGDLLSHYVTESVENWIEDLTARLEQDKAEYVIMPSEGVDPDRLNELKRHLSNKFSVVPVRTSGLREARQVLSEHLDPGGSSLPADVLSAVVLAKRAIKPYEEWSGIDPIKLGLAEYQADLDQGRLSRLLLEMKRVAKLRPHEDSIPSFGPLSSSFNPLVRSMADLKPGMSVPGTVTNITSFGVFVNIGLKQEGMIHISELSDSFVRDPHELVKIGQQVQPTVLSVDETRKRISLTLRNGTRQPGASRGQGAAMRKGAKGGERVEALKNLEELFKKKP